MIKKILAFIYIAFCVSLAHSQSDPMVVFKNVAIRHERNGWRVIEVLTMPVHFNLIKGDLIVRIDGKNAAETGPMQIASIFNDGDRRNIDLFIERGYFRMETKLREMSSLDIDPAGSIPFKRVASGFSAPDAEFNDIDGKPLTLEQFKGKWLLIEFTGTWCESCMKRLPEILSTVEHNDLSLNLLVVDLNDGAEAVRRMQQKYAITSPITTARPWSQLPIGFGIGTNQLTGRIPAFVLIRPDGEVASIEIGAFGADHIEQKIECMMACKADDVPN